MLLYTVEMSIMYLSNCLYDYKYVWKYQTEIQKAPITPERSPVPLSCQQQLSSGSTFSEFYQSLNFLYILVWVWFII